MSRQVLEQELSKIEKPAGIANPKDFRFEVVKFSLRARAKNGGKNPTGRATRNPRGDRAAHVQPGRGPAARDQLRREEGQRDRKKHEEFVQRMVERGYTARQVRRLVEWYMRVKKSS